jgi:hypothetical protein
MKTPPVVPPKDLPEPEFVVNQPVTYANHGDPVEAVVSFVSALGLYVVKWPGHTCTARHDELAPVELLPCGHPRSAVRGERVTHWCSECQKEAEANA